MKIEFNVTLSGHAMTKLKVNTNKLIVGYQQDVGGADELWDWLNEKGIQADDVLLITVVGESTQDRAISDALRTMHANNINHITFKVDQRKNKSALVHFTAAVEAGNLVRYEISDHNDSMVTYTYSDAQKVFDRYMKHGWNLV